MIYHLATCKHVQLLVHLLHGARVLHVGRLELHKPIIKMINNMFFKKRDVFFSLLIAKMFQDYFPSLCAVFPIYKEEKTMKYDMMY